jgi:hypothetical protein
MTMFIFFVLRKHRITLNYPSLDAPFDALQNETISLSLNCDTPSHCDYLILSRV